MSAGNDRELDRVLARVADPVMPAGLVERILATVPHLPQDIEPAAATSVTPERQGGNWQIRPAALGMIAAGVAALVVFAFPAAAPNHGPALDPAPAVAAHVAARMPDAALPAVAKTAVSPVVPARKAMLARAAGSAATVQADSPATLPASVIEPAPAQQGPELAAAESVPRGPKLGPPIPDDLAQGDGSGRGANPLAPAPQSGFGFRGGAGD